MTEPLDLAAIDPSGAVAEAHERAETRRDLLLGTLGGLVVAGGWAAAPLLGAPARQYDAGILNYALTLEYVQAAFYTEAERLGALRGREAMVARTLGGVERAHVAAFRSALGSAAVKRPSFDFRGTTEDGETFLRTAVAFEDLGAAAYKAQLLRIRQPEIVSVAASVHSVEARHAAWMRYLVGAVPATAALDEPSDRQRTLQLVASTRFITAAPRTDASSTPRFTG